METFPAISLKNKTHFVRETSLDDRMSETFIHHDPQDHPFLQPWCCDEVSYSPLQETSALKPFGPVLIHEDEPLSAPQRHHHGLYSDIYLPSPPLTGSVLKPAGLPDVCDTRYMDSDRTDHSSHTPLSRLLTVSHDVFRHPQPPSPPVDTPELIQRTLPDSRTTEPLSPPLTSPVDLLDLPSLSTFASPDGDGPDLHSQFCFGGRDDDNDSCVASSSKQRCCWDGTKTSGVGLGATYEPHGHPPPPQLTPVPELLTPDTPTWSTSSMLDPLFEDSAMDWSASGSSDFNRDLHTPLEPPKPRGLSFDSSQEDSYDFLEAMHSSSLRPLRSFTMPPSTLQLNDLWSGPRTMDIDHDQPSRPSRSEPLNLNLAGFDDSASSLIEDVRSDGFPSALLTPSPRPPPLSLFDEPSYVKHGEPSSDFYMEAPSSPHSPHMQLLPCDEDEMFVEPLPTDTISPALLGLPDMDVGLGLDVDPGLDRSPSPSDYELQLLEGGQLDLPLHDLPEDEFQQLRAYYEQLAHAETAAKEREAVLDRRVKDVSALLKPPKAVPDPVVMRARRQEYRVASDLRAEARRARKEEKHRLRELGTLLDLKLETRVFHAKGAMRSVAHLVADMVFKRHDRSRALANRKAASSSRPSAPSPLRSSSPADSDNDDGSEDMMTDDDFDSI